MARSLGICPQQAGPEVEGKQEDDQGGQADRKTDRRGGGWGKGGTTGAGTSPAGALAHELCCHTKGGSFRVGLKDGGRGRGIYIYIYFFCVFFLPLRLSRCPYMGKPLSGVGEQYCYTHWYVA